MKLTNSLKKIIFEAFSQKLIQTLVDKFSQETKDSKSTILSLISDFEKYQQGLPVDKRDITKYTYNDLKNLIESKKIKKKIQSDFLQMKKTNENVNDSLLNKNIKKFHEIKSALPEEKRDINNFTYLGLDKFLDDNYEKLLIKIYTPKFKKEEPQTSEETINGYIRNYVSSFDEIPNNSQLINFLTFNEFEHLVDSVAAKKDVGGENKIQDYSDVDLIYDKENQIIFRPLTKEQCIKYKRGRAWCITWLGANNRYYWYRLDKNRTIYYSIDEDKPYDDKNHIIVILVNPDGSKLVADKSNAPPNDHGDSIVPWSYIVDKQPKLADLEHLFKPIKLSEYEEKLINNVRNKKVGDDPKKEFDTYEMLEIWVELLSTSLTDIQYSNLPIDLKKKYIVSGFALSSNMIDNSETPILNYYVKKRIEVLQNARLRDLSESDIKLLTMPMASKVKESLKDKFRSQLPSFKKKDTVEIVYPDSELSKFLVIFGLDDLIETLPSEIRHFSFENKGKDNFTIKFPNTFGQYKNLESITLSNIIDTLPDSIGTLPNLQFLAVPDNPKLTSLPDTIYNMPSLNFLRIDGSNVEIPEKYKDNFKLAYKGFYIKQNTK